MPRDDTGPVKGLLVGVTLDDALPVAPAAALDDDVGEGFAVF